MRKMQLTGWACLLSGSLGAILSAPGWAAPITVDANANVHPISPLIYGISAGGSAFHKTMGVTLNRWGGNQISRSNWENNDSNSGADWGLCNQAYLGRGAFSNVSQGSGAAGQSSVNAFNNSKNNGMNLILSIPNIGWVAKDGNNNNCSNGVPASDGPPINASGAISGYDPAANRSATSFRSVIQKGSAFSYPPSTTDNTVYQDEWIAYMVSRFGRADAGGIQFYGFDNEYDLWSHTHRDIHPARVGYDELLSLFSTFADAVKAVDSSAKVTGPISWGWTNYWYSPLDAGNNNYGTAADRAAHGNVPLLQWFLRNMRTHDQQVGHRTLDVLDVHVYPQCLAPSYSVCPYSSDVSATAQAYRLRSTRDLWDPTYRNESWMAGTEGGPNLQVIRRLKGWISQEYPGTGLGITEWNWGADDHINGGLAVADVLGIFGREDVYLANYWTYPADQSPGYWAYRMYRNYDDSSGHFGDISVNADVPAADIDKVSVYASKDSATGQLKVMVINKQPAAQYINAINLSNFTPSGSGQVYRYSQADTSQILRMPDLAQVTQTLSYAFEPYSITLLIIDGAGGGCKVGDVNCSGQIDITDLSMLLSRWNGSDATCDFNHDGRVDVTDLSMLLSNWGQ